MGCTCYKTLINGITPHFHEYATYFASAEAIFCADKIKIVWQRKGMNSYFEIQNLIHEMTWMLDNEREEEMIRTLMKDCIFKTPPNYTEMPAIDQAKWAGMAHKRWGPDKRNKTKHNISNLHLVIDEEAGTATSRCYLTIYQGVPEIGFPLQPIFCGTYHDTFKRDESGKWYYATHQLDIDIEGECCNHRNDFSQGGFDPDGEHPDRKS